MLYLTLVSPLALADDNPISTNIMVLNPGALLTLPTVYMSPVKFLGWNIHIKLTKWVVLPRPASKYARWNIRTHLMGGSYSNSNP